MVSELAWVLKNMGSNRGLVNPKTIKLVCSMELSGEMKGGGGRHLQQYFSYIVVVSFIGGGNQGTWQEIETSIIIWSFDSKKGGGVIRSHQSKDTQYNDQTDKQWTKYYTKMCSGNVSNSYSTCVSCWRNKLWLWTNDLCEILYKDSSLNFDL